MLWIFRYFRRLLVPEEISTYEKILKRQARRLSNFTDCKLNQAQRTIAIDFYGYKSLKDLKEHISKGTTKQDTINLLNFTTTPECLISLQRNWFLINEAFDAIEYLNEFDRLAVISCILNMPLDEFKNIIDPKE